MSLAKKSISWYGLSLSVGDVAERPRSPSPSLNEIDTISESRPFGAFRKDIPSYVIVGELLNSGGLKQAPNNAMEITNKKALLTGFISNFENVKLTKRLETFKSFVSKIYSVNEVSFREIALEVFRYQAFFNPIYKAFINHLGIAVEKVDALHDIPFLPISFFRTHLIKTGNWQEESVFESSGTTDSVPSRHLIADKKFYEKHAQRCFELFFGPLERFHFFALLPSYLERNNSSLVAMIDFFIRQSGSSCSGFYRYDYEGLSRKLQELKDDSRECILWGVSFALLDLAEQFPQDLSHCMVFETGGMKGRRKEITRNEMHDRLKEGISVKALFSEYGMTELLSQAYSMNGTNRFVCPPWMRVIGRDITDPFRKGLLSENVGINVIDLANWQTMSFIETEDLGKIFSDGSFEVLGRLDNTDLRGCNLMID